MSDAVDARGKAWGESWGRLEAAEKVKRKAFEAAGGTDGPLPDQYWSMIAEADVFAKLSVVPEIIGMMAGSYLDQRDEEERRQEQMKQDLLDRAEKKGAASADDLLSCTCEFDKSQCPIHNEGDDVEDDEESRSS
jgi:hypothetical protein